MTYEEALHSDERIIEYDGRLICFANLDENSKESEAFFDEYMDRAIEFYKKHGNPGIDTTAQKVDWKYVTPPLDGGFFIGEKGWDSLEIYYEKAHNEAEKTWSYQSALLEYLEDHDV